MTGKRIKTAGAARPKRQGSGTPRRGGRKSVRTPRKSALAVGRVRLRPGEIVIPPEVLTPALMEELARIYKAAGLEIEDYVVAGADDEG